MARHFSRANASTFNPINGQEYTPTPQPRPHQAHTKHTDIWKADTPQAAAAAGSRPNSGIAHRRATSSQGVASTARTETAADNSTAPAAPTSPSRHTPRVMSVMQNGQVKALGSGYKLTSPTLARTSFDSSVNLFDQSNPYNTGQQLDKHTSPSPSRRPSSRGSSTFSLFDPSLETTNTSSRPTTAKRDAVTRQTTEEQPVIPHSKGRSTIHPNAQSTEESIFPRKQKATSSLHQQHPRLAHGNASSVKTSFEWEGHDNHEETSTRAGKRVASDEFVSAVTHGVVPSGGAIEDPRGVLIHPKSARQRALASGINPIPHYQMDHFNKPPVIVDRTPQPKIWKI